jgi:hypothetical protein
LIRIFEELKRQWGFDGIHGGDLKESLFKELSIGKSHQNFTKITIN